MNRFGRKLMKYFLGKSQEYKRDYKEISYEVKHIQKKTLITIYRTIVGVASLSATGAYLAYNTYFKYKYIPLLLLKVDEKPIPLDENLELLAIREWNTAHVSRSYKLLGLMNFFPCKGADIFSIGDLMTRTGVDMALPFNFTYNTVADVKLKEVTLFGKSLDQSSDISMATQRLIESLVLSDKAKRFAITREIHFTERNRVMTEAANVMFSTMMAFGCGQQIILSLNIRRRYLLSFILRGVSLVSGIGVWFLIRQAYTYGWNVAADKSAVAQGPDYYEGAVEYYQKLMQRNAALYVLLGSYGQKRLTREGEPKGIFTSVPSIKKRLQMIRDLNPKLEASESIESDSESNSKQF